MLFDKISIEQKVKEVVIRKMKFKEVISEVLPNKNLFDISGSSYRNYWKMCRGLEHEYKKYGLVIADCDECKLLTISDIANFIYSFLKKKKS